MKTKMKTTLLLLLFLIAHTDASGKDSDLKCSNKTIAELGKNVTLDCYCEPPCDVTHEVLEWKFNQKTFVLAYRGTYNANQQDLQFDDRAQVSSTERLKNGNFSVTISRFNKSDEGTYTCNVGNKTCSVELKVMTEDIQTAGARGDNTTTSDGLRTGVIIGPVVGVLVLVFAALAAWRIYRNRRRQRGGKEN